MANGWIANHPSQIGQRGDGLPYDFGGRYFGMRCHGANDEAVTFARDAAKSCDLAKVDQRARRRQTIFQRRQQCHAAGEKLGFGNHQRAVLLHRRRLWRGNK